MPRSTKKKRKGQSRLQKANVVKARESLQKPKTRPLPKASVLQKKLKSTQQQLRVAQDDLQRYKRRFYNERSRRIRISKANQQLKANRKLVKVENSRMRFVVERLGKELLEVKEESQIALAHLKEKVRVLEASRKDLLHDRTVLRKRMERLKDTKRRMKVKMKQMMMKKPMAYRLMHKGVYTRQARALARYMASTGIAEKKVGEALKEIGSVLGMEVSHIMSERTVQRCVLEAGVAADIQIAYEMCKASKLCYSSDSTSHRRIEYESRFIALEVVDYNNPDAEPQWTMRSLGVDTSVDHTSKTQVDGLKKRMEELSRVFNESPLAKREGLTFNPDDFAYKLIGTSGDHAADQKKCHQLISEWRMDVIHQRMGEEALFKWNPGAVVGILYGLKRKQVDDLGGWEAFNALSEEEKEKSDAEIIREVGKQIFENLPEDEQKKLTRFIRTGCCMHKDLNCFKCGDKAMQEIWTHKPVQPIVLANKDNAAVLSGVGEGTELTAEQKRAASESKQGGSKAVELGGMIFRNKDSKKGQQDLYKIWMEEKVGFEVPFPDVSNTRYGTHGEGAATILVYLDEFKGFMKHVFYVKDKAGHTNIEKNFASALEDIPTLTELVVLAMYSIAVSRAFMATVRETPNLLHLRPFFERKDTFLQRIIDTPSIWSTPSDAYNNIFLDGGDPDIWAVKVLHAVHKLAPTLPDLDDAIRAFATGARTAFVERFSDEFRAGSGLDTLTIEEQQSYFFPSTNDVNEGALGSWRLAQRRRVAETIHKFNAGFTSSINDTESFIESKLTSLQDEEYLRRQARQRDESGIQREMKKRQVEADRKKAEANLVKEVARKQKQQDRLAVLEVTSRKLVLDESEIQKLTKDQLNEQLDYHRNAEKGLPDIPQEVRVPLKSKMTTNALRKEVLIRAAIRYRARNGPQNDTPPLDIPR